MKTLRYADKVSIKIKLIVFAIVALIAVAIPAYYSNQKTVQQVELAAMSIEGVPLAQQTVQLRKLIAQHRGTSARWMGGDDTARGTLTGLAKDVDDAFDRLSRELKSSAYGNDADVLLGKFRSRWQDIQYSALNKTQPGADVFNNHSGLIVNIGEVNAAILRSYKLIYAPSDSAYHLVIANFNALPALNDTLGKIRGRGAGALASGSLLADARATLIGLVNNANQANLEFLLNLRSASESGSDQRLASLSRDADDFEQAISQVKDLLDQNIMQPEVLTFPSGEFFDSVTAKMSNLYSKQSQYVTTLTSLLDAYQQEVIAERNALWMQLAILVLFAALVFVAVNYSITNGIAQVVEALSKLSKNDFEINFSHQRSDEVGVIQGSIDSLKSSLQEFTDQSVEALRVKQALDNSSTCFMMADKDRNIVYLNDSVQKMLKEAEADIKKDLPNFNASDLLGNNIDTFHKHPEHQRNLLDRLTTTHIANLNLGAYSFRLILNPIYAEDGETLGHSVEWHDMTEVYERERSTARILESLNCTSTNVMIADADREIIYLNRSVQEMLRTVESDLKKVLPHFNADDLVGKKIDTFHQNPAHQAGLLEKLVKPYETQITVGNRHFRLIANPIMSEDGERLGSVVEWLDRTVEVQAEQEIAHIVDSAVRGDFSSRAEEAGKDGFYLGLSQGLNQLLDITERGLKDISEVLLAISKGDLTKRIDAEFEGTFDDMKNYCNTSADTLAEVISEIREASQTITSGSQEIATGNADLSSRTEQQASNLEETASSMEEITSTVQLNADNAKQANTLASDASNVATDGGKLIEKVVHTMSGINESATKIADIIGVIDGIAFQTNILALNAAVEAARAGEQGRGFAVVASEVRTLAQRSANAAKDIKELISDSVSKIESGNELVNQSGETMSNIVDAIKRVNDIMSEIASASAEQASGIDEINKAIVQMDEMTQQNAALVEQAAAAAESMNNQAQQLVERVETFHLDESMVSEHKRPVATLEHKPAGPAKGQELVEPDLPSSSVDDDDEWESF